MHDTTADTFDADVLACPQPVVVDFWAPWCRPCVQVARVLGELELRVRGVTFVRLNVDENAATAARPGVLALPAVIIVAGGEARATLVGGRRPGDYERALAPWLESSSR